jgi:hypothetical protein
MTNSERDQLLDAMTQLSSRYPNWRFGQLVANVAGWVDVELWDVEDEQLLSAARSHLAEIANSDRVPQPA